MHVYIYAYIYCSMHSPLWGTPQSSSELTGLDLGEFGSFKCKSLRFVFLVIAFVVATRRIAPWDAAGISWLCCRSLLPPPAFLGAVRPSGYFVSS